MKVILKRCETYDVAKIKEQLLICIENMGGINKFVSTTDKVLLKINLVIKKRPDEAATTHPAFVQALAEIFIENGNDVLIGDSPGGVFNKIALAPIYKVTGMEDVANKTGAKLNYNFDSFELKCNNAKTYKKFQAVDMLNDVTKVINVSKFKTHSMMTFTGATKNMFGIVPGILKGEFHYNVHQYDAFADVLIDICMASNPVLSFMDAIEGMEGAGPTAGNPRKINLIIASESPYHLDKVACDIINLNTDKVPLLAACVNRNLITKDFSDIEFLGDNIKDFYINDFKLPDTTGNLNEEILNKIPLFLRKYLDKHLKTRPVFDFDTCIGCKICGDNCPPSIISFDKNKKPHADLDKCIRCYCCQELCPKKAVSAYKPLLFKMLTKKL